MTSCAHFYFGLHGYAQSPPGVPRSVLPSQRGARDRSSTTVLNNNKKTAPFSFQDCRLCCATRPVRSWSCSPASSCGPPNRVPHRPSPCPARVLRASCCASRSAPRWRCQSLTPPPAQHCRALPGCWTRGLERKQDGGGASSASDKATIQWYYYFFPAAAVAPECPAVLKQLPA